MPPATSGPRSPTSSGGALPLLPGSRPKRRLGAIQSHSVAASVSTNTSGTATPFLRPRKWPVLVPHGRTTRPRAQLVRTRSVVPPAGRDDVPRFFGAGAPPGTTDCRRNRRCVSPQGRHVTGTLRWGTLALAARGAFTMLVWGSPAEPASVKGGEAPAPAGDQGWHVQARQGPGPEVKYQDAPGSRMARSPAPRAACAGVGEVGVARRRPRSPSRTRGCTPWDAPSRAGVGPAVKARRPRYCPLQGAELIQRLLRSCAGRRGSRGRGRCVLSARPASKGSAALRCDAVAPGWVGRRRVGAPAVASPAVPCAPRCERRSGEGRRRGEERRMKVTGLRRRPTASPWGVGWVTPMGARERLWWGLHPLRGHRRGADRDGPRGRPQRAQTRAPRRGEDPRGVAGLWKRMMDFVFKGGRERGGGQGDDWGHRRRPQ